MKDRDLTDLRLKSCVKEVAGAGWANLIYNGVRAGHASPVKNKTHWSWGWEKQREETALSAEEKTYVIQELRRLPFETEFIETFIATTFNQSNEAY